MIKPQTHKRVHAARVILRLGMGHWTEASSLGKCKLTQFIHTSQLTYSLKIFWKFYHRHRDKYYGCRATDITGTLTPWTRETTTATHIPVWRWSTLWGVCTRGSPAAGTGCWGGWFSGSIGRGHTAPEGDTRTERESESEREGQTQRQRETET